MPIIPLSYLWSGFQKSKFGSQKVLKWPYYLHFWTNYSHRFCHCFFLLAIMHLPMVLCIKISIIENILRVSAFLFDSIMITIRQNIETKYSAYVPLFKFLTWLHLVHQDFNPIVKVETSVAMDSRDIKNMNLTFRLTITSNMKYKKIIDF